MRGAAEAEDKGLGTKIAEMVIAPIYANLPSDLQVRAAVEC